MLLPNRNLIFICGKGGVGKTSISQSLAWSLAAKGKETLWVEFENPTRMPGDKTSPRRSLTHLNVNASLAFEEYIKMKLGGSLVTKLFLQNQLISYLSQAAPGLSDLILLGKIWHERLHFEHIVVDMPSTGYGLALFQSTINYSKLFKGGPIHHDAEAMLSTVGDPEQCEHWIIALPEEMPLVESLELKAQLKEIFPKIQPKFLVNKMFPTVQKEFVQPSDREASPFATSISDYCQKRIVLERSNLSLWKTQNIQFRECPHLLPGFETKDLAAVLEKIL